MIVWIAEREVEYEGSDFLGCFKTADGGKRACERHAAKFHRGTPPVEWRPGNVEDSWISSASYSDYTVFPSEVEE